MIHPELRCPNCDQYGFVAPVEPGDIVEALGAICHCCGHFMDKDELTKRLDKRTKTARTSTVA